MHLRLNFRLYPTDIQEQSFKQAAGNTRWIWNYFLTQNKINYEFYKKFIFNFDMNNFDPRNKEQTQSQVVKAYQSSAKTAADWDKANALLSRLNTISNSNIPGTQ